MEGEQQRVLLGGQNKCDSRSRSTEPEPEPKPEPPKADVFVRTFEADDDPEVQRIFREGLMEMVEDTAFRGLRHHPESLLLYGAMTAVCFVVTGSWLLTALVPPAVLWARYLCSRRVALRYLETARRGDMADIQAVYLTPPDSCLWVAVWQGSVVGTVAATGRRPKTRRSGGIGGAPGGGGDLELCRMSVDRRHRHRGVGGALARAVLAFAAARGFSSVVLGTTAYSPAAHKLYRRLGFRRVGEVRGHQVANEGRHASTLMERMFYRVSHHHYSLDVLDISPHRDQ